MDLSEDKRAHAAVYHNYTFLFGMPAIALLIFFTYPYIRSATDCFSREDSDSQTSGASSAGMAFYALHSGVSISVFLIFTRVFKKSVSFSLYSRTCVLAGLTAFVISGLGIALEKFVFRKTVEETLLEDSRAVYGVRLWLHATVEEAAKLLATVLYVKFSQVPATNRVTSEKQFVLLAASAGFGFGLIENFFYLAKFSYFVRSGELRLWHGVAVQRSFDCMHPILASLAALLLNSTRTLFFFSKALVVPCLAHWLFNFVWGLLDSPWTYVAAFAPLAASVAFLFVRVRRIS